MQKTAAEHTQDILDEIRKRRATQVAMHGYDTAHDDTHKRGELLSASWGAIACLRNALNGTCEYRRLLIDAASMVVAEVERIDRLKQKEKPTLADQIAQFLAEEFEQQSTIGTSVCDKPYIVAHTHEVASKIASFLTEKADKTA